MTVSKTVGGGSNPSGYAKNNLKKCLTLIKSGVIIHIYAEKSATLFNIVEQIFCPRGGMVDTRDLKSLAFGRAGSSPARGTNFYAPFVYRLGHIPFTDVRGVRFSYGVPVMERWVSG